jgi:CBS domain-containing protein
MAGDTDGRYIPRMKKVRDIMTSDPRCVAPDTKISEAAKIMGELDIGALPICKNDRLAGMVTDRDIAVRAVAQGRDPTKTTVEETMTEGIVFIYDDEDVEAAARLFETRRIRRLPVLNRDKRMVGIISLGDLAVNAGVGLGGEALKEVSEPSHAQAH